MRTREQIEKAIQMNRSQIEFLESQNDGAIKLHETAIAALESELAELAAPVADKFAVGDRVVAVGVIQDEIDGDGDYEVRFQDGWAGAGIACVPATALQPIGDFLKTDAKVALKPKDHVAALVEKFSNDAPGYPTDRGQYDHRIGGTDYKLTITRADAPDAKPAPEIAGYCVERIEPVVEGCSRYGTMHETRELAEGALRTIYNSGGKYRVRTLIAAAQEGGRS